MNIVLSGRRGVFVFLGDGGGGLIVTSMRLSNAAILMTRVSNAFITAGHLKVSNLDIPKRKNPGSTHA